MDNLVNSVIYLVAAILCAAVLGLIFTKLYKRSTKERAFVRTGAGGQLVVLSGGALVLPGFHDMHVVNMSTLNLRVDQANEKSLTTKDRLRVDVSVDFYVRVANTVDAVATAAQTIGQLTLQPQQLKALIEGKFVAALRSVATQMTMTELQDQRADFVQRVQTAVTEDLEKNGLMLETASLTRLEQTRKEFFDPNNVFDAEGLTAITRETEARRKLRNDIEQETKVSIQKKNMETTELSLDIDRQQEQATLKNQQDVARMRAEQEAEVARTKAAGKRASEQAQIAADQEIETARLASQQAVAEAEAARQRATETANIQAQTAIDVAAQEKAITLANKSREESEARTIAEEARAKSVVAEEQVVTARETERAKREQMVQVIQATAQAEQESAGITVKAEAERKAAQARAEAQRTAAEAERDSAVLRAAGIVAEGEAQAAALRERNAAQNTMSKEVMAMQVQIETLHALPDLMGVMVRSIEKIDSIKVVELSGLGGALNGGSVGSSVGTSGSLADQVGNVAMRHRTLGPMMDSLMAELGLDGSTPAALVESARNLARTSSLSMTTGDNGVVEVAASDEATTATAVEHA